MVADDVTRSGGQIGVKIVRHGRLIAFQMA
jgi:hypothetical protein